jgi:uncharacterized protein (DUF433 family)
MYIYKNISIEEGKRNSKPCICEMRITVEDILLWLASGMSFEDIIHDFPELNKEDIMIALEFSGSVDDPEVRKMLMDYFDQGLQKELKEVLDKKKYSTKDYHRMLSGTFL